MFDTQWSDYNIVDATPFGRDVLKELADECHRQGIALHLYYSHLDWYRETTIRWDVPEGEPDVPNMGNGKPTMNS